MLEIILLAVLASKLSKMASSKGRSGGWAALGPVLWIGGEVVGFVIGLATLGDIMSSYMFALIGAAVGALVSYLVVNSLSVAPGFEAMAAQGEWDSRGQGCPACGSLQTELRGNELVCFACDTRTPVGYPGMAPYGAYPPQGYPPQGYPPPGYPPPGYPPPGYPPPGYPPPGYPPQGYPPPGYPQQGYPPPGAPPGSQPGTPGQPPPGPQGPWGTEPPEGRGGSG